MNSRNLKRTKEMVSLALIGLTVILCFFQPASVSAQQIYNTAFLTDQDLEDFASMNAAQIQAFLVAKNSYFRQPVADADGAIFDPSAVIAESTTHYKINPKVILATLQKENSYVTKSTPPSSTTLASLLGCAGPAEVLPVPEKTARWQFWCAAERFRAYQNALSNTAKGATPSGWKVGVSKNTQDGVAVTPATKAVAGQFTYTPYAGPKWGGNQSQFGGVSLFYQYWVDFGFGQPTGMGTSTPPVVQPNPTDLPGSPTATLLIFDTSGSMMDPDASGSSKIDAALKAGGNILDVISAENSASGTKSSAQVGVIGYNSEAYIVSQMTADIPSVRSALQNLHATDSTAMPDGLKAGLDLLGSSGLGGRQIIILLSDGLPNIPLNKDPSIRDPAAIQQQVLDLARQAGQRGICLYTIGLGDPTNMSGSLDENFLKNVAKASGCGEYYNARDAVDLSGIYVEVRHRSTGNIILNQSGQINQGQTIDLGQVDVQPNQATMLFTLNWPGSRLEPTVIDPAGKQVNSSYPGATISAASSLVSIIVNNPMAGAWKIRILGAEVPEGITAFRAILSTRQGSAPAPTVPAVPAAPPVSSGSFPVVVLIIVVSGGMIGVYAYSRTLKRASRVSTASGGGRLILAAANGESQRQFPLQDGFTIGRGTGSHLQLKDPSVSRRHATLRKADGDWFIQDAASAGGTFVNGQRVAAARLNTGDCIQIGDHTLVFYKD